MAKRFTDTDKWKKESFGDLSLKMKLVWIYLCDNCDHAGIWDSNLRLLSFHLGEPVSRDEIAEAFGDKVVWLSETKLFLQSFIDFQYGSLNPDNRAHLSVIQRLKKEGACKGLRSSIQGAKDKEKDKDKELDKELEGGVGETKITFDFERAYKSYPRHEGKAEGLKHLAVQIKTPESFERFETAVVHYAELCAKRKTEKKFVKLFSSFVGTKSGQPWLEFVDRPKELDEDPRAEAKKADGKSWLAEMIGGSAS